MAIRRFGEASSGTRTGWVYQIWTLAPVEGQNKDMCGVRMENFDGQMTARCQTEKPEPRAPAMTVSTLVSRLAMMSIRTLAMNHA